MGIPVSLEDAPTLEALLREPVRYGGRITQVVAAAAAYAAGDVLSNSVTDNAGVPLYIDALARTPGGVVTITSILARCSVAAVLASFRLHFFNYQPLVAEVEMDDNIPFSLKTAAGYDKWLDSILLNAVANRGTVGSGSTTANINQSFKCAPGQTGLWTVITTEVAEANQGANMSLSFDFFTL